MRDYFCKISSSPFHPHYFLPAWYFLLFVLDVSHLLGPCPGEFKSISSMLELTIILPGFWLFGTDLFWSCWKVAGSDLADCLQFFYWIDSNGSVSAEPPGPAFYGQIGGREHVPFSDELPMLSVADPPPDADFSPWSCWRNASRDATLLLANRSLTFFFSSPLSEGMGWQGRE